MSDPGRHRHCHRHLMFINNLIITLFHKVSFQTMNFAGARHQSIVFSLASHFTKWFGISIDDVLTFLL